MKHNNHHSKPELTVRCRRAVSVYTRGYGESSKQHILAAGHLVLVVVARDGEEVGRDGEAAVLAAAAEPEDQVKRGLLLDVVVGEGAAVLQLLPCEDEALLVGWDA
jgi:hypothetical protein